MRGLIYRELYLARKSYIGGLIAVAMFIILGVLIRMSLLYGNLADLEADAYKMVDLVSYIAFSYLPLVLLFIPFAGDGGVSISDYKSKWMLYEYTLPYNEKQLAGVKYIIKIGLMLLAFLLAFGNLLLFGGLSGQGIRGNAAQDIEGIGVYNMEWNSIKILLIVMMLPDSTFSPPVCSVNHPAKVYPVLVVSGSSPYISLKTTFFEANETLSPPFLSKVTVRITP